MSSLYILENRALSEVSFANMFSHFGALFILPMFSLAMQKLFILMKSHFFVLSFMSLALGDILVKILLHGNSEIFLFSLLALLWWCDLHLSFIHLEFIFVYGVSWWSSFIFLHVVVQISQHHLLKKLLILHFMLLLLLSNLIDYRVMS